MKICFKAILLLSLFLACKSEEEKPIEVDQKGELEMVFDQNKWRVKKGDTYPFRDRMLKDVVYNDTIRSLNQLELTDLLGPPDRINENHLYYTIARKGLGAFTLNEKTMVVKIKEDNSIEWIKIHE